MTDRLTNDVFISYAREDRARAQQLVEVLVRRGWSVWWDREIPPGAVFDDVIERALQGARSVVVLWSRHSVSSSWAKAEAADGSARGVLIPVMLEAVSAPLEFRRLEAIDLTDWQGDSEHTEIHRLVQAVGRLLEQKAPVSRAPAIEANAGARLRKRRAAPFIAIGASLLAIAIALLFWGPFARDTLPRATYPATTSAGVAATPASRINLLASENGGQLISASGAVWRATVDGSTSGEFTNGGSDIREEAVYGFKDNRPARFDTFALFIPGAGDNVKQFELLASDARESGFRPIGTFQARNSQDIDAPYQRFEFPLVTARYLKFKLVSSYGIGYTLLTEFQLWGSLEN